MNNNEAQIRTFYDAFQKRDWQAMHSCYHEHIEFSDPVFVNLTGKQAFAMWHMLVSSARDLDIICENIQADEEHGRCHWEAIYTFSKTGRRVHNKIDAKFKFSDGKIILHNDSFDLWKWEKMALGLTGQLLGWTDFLKRKVQAQAAKNLFRFIEANPQYK